MGTLGDKYEREDLAVSAIGTPNLLVEMTRAVVAAVHPEQVLVFGSHARGDATADSDVDLLVVERPPEANALGRALADRLRRAAWGTPPLGTGRSEPTA